MQKVLWGLSVIMIAAMAGCGGGGGGATGPSALRLSDNIVGTWQVANLGLPNDQIVIEDDGDVAVEATGSKTRSDSSSSLVVIGSCNGSGTLSLNGSWTVNGVEHSIVATGNVDSTASALSLSATVRQDEEIICQNVTVTGVKDDDASDQSDDDIETPPAPPDLDDDPYDTPPAPPF
jgi:hypothetical protein